MDDTELLRLANLRCSITILRSCRMAEVWQDEGGVKRPPSTRSSFSDALLVLYECRWMEIWYFKFGQGMELLTWIIWFALEHLTICGCEDRWKGGSLDCREGGPSLKDQNRALHYLPNIVSSPISSPTTSTLAAIQTRNRPRAVKVIHITLLARL